MLGAKATAAPLKVAVTLLLAANPVPATVIVEPLVAVVGVRVAAGVTEIAAWTLRPVFPSLKVSKYDPAKRPVGIMNHVVSEYALEPLLGTVTEPNCSTLFTVT